MLTRSAGILIPLFSLRTRSDLGRGEILDLAPMIDLARDMGHRLIQLLPLDEGAPEETSPYSAMSVFAIDPVYISAQALPGIGTVTMTRALAEIGPRRMVPRPSYRPLKLRMLEHAWRVFRSRASAQARNEFDRFIERNSSWLDDYALFRALKERYDWCPWEQWPSELARRAPGALDTARADLADQILKYSWWQFAAHRQWREMRLYAQERGVKLGGDMAFSPSRDSAEVWAHQEEFDLGRTVGAPPDAFNPNGQRWGLPLPRWSAMGEGGYALWSARARHAGDLFDLVRIDHVVGLYRTFSFAEDPDAPGAFVPDDENAQLTQGEAVMRALRTAAHPCDLIAEDLGSVPPSVRKSLTAMGVPGYKVMQWEREWEAADKNFNDPASYPEASLATTGTHDTEALTVWWGMQSVSERERLVEALGLASRVDAVRELGEQGVDAVLGALYASPSILTVEPLQDLFIWRARINRPGTVSDFNWTWRLPLPIERLRGKPWIASRIAKLRAISARTGRIPE
jgi:4-alpha-glucanotransferase